MVRAHVGPHFFNIDMFFIIEIFVAFKLLWREVFTERSRSEPMWDHILRANKGQY